MNLDFDIRAIFQDQTASSIGLDRYAYIMNRFNATDVSSDTNFQRMFNGFYRVRRNEQWRKAYYGLFEQAKSKTLNFADIINYMYENTGNIEPSFSSKMYATVYPDKPIWDKYVLQNLNLELKGKSKAEKLNNAITLYAEIEKWYDNFMKTDKAVEWLAAFDFAWPDYTNISSIKKVDFVLWQNR